MMKRAERCRRWFMRSTRETGGRIEVEKIEVKKVKAEEKRERRRHTPEEKCRAVLAIWTERRRPGEVCRDLGVDWGVLQQWQDRAMQGMLMGLQPRVWVERGVALSPRLAVLLKKSQAGMMRGLDKRLKKLQENRVPQEEQEMAAEEKL
jgi:transposase-like protein